VADSMDWRHRAACRDEPGELFFAVGSSGPALLQIAEAKTVCRRCPVTVQCLDMALSMGLDHGVFGGMSEDERRALKRRQARTRQRAKATTPKPAEETAPREPARVDGLLVAAPGTVADRLYQEHTWGQRLHVVMVDGRSACGSLRLDVGHRLPPAALRASFRCRRKACKDLLALADREFLAVSHG
jgi:WhiB family redox-sensing transcriptional regulator